MKILATRIANELRKAKHCAVYEPELTRYGQTAKTAKRKSRYLLKSTAGGFVTTAMDSAQSLIKNRLLNPCDYENSLWTN